MKEQSAVQWLVDSIEGLEKSWVENIINTDEYFSNIEWVKIKAKEMHKQQIIDAWHKGYDNQSPMIDEENCGQTFYNETYGSKGSDEHIVDTTKMISSQTEISDEEIEKGAIEYYESPVGNIDREIGFRYAIKWYREQLKSGASQEK